MIPISDLTALTAAERIALAVAEAQLARGENPGPNVTAALALAVRRLAGDPDPTVVIGGDS